MGCRAIRMDVGARRRGERRRLHQPHEERTPPSVVRHRPTTTDAAEPSPAIVPSDVGHHQLAVGGTDRGEDCALVCDRELCVELPSLSWLELLKLEQVDALVGSGRISDAHGAVRHAG